MTSKARIGSMSLVVFGAVMQANLSFAQSPATEQPANTMGGVYDCAAMPEFISKVGLQEPVAIDTTLLRLPGLTMRELQGRKRIYQGNTWKQTGHVSSTVRDSAGNIYVIPVPSISLDINPLSKRNRVYKVDTKTGIMEPLLDLPMPAEESQTNPFGTLGLTLDCQTNSLYVASVAGSTPSKINGIIYQIDLLTGSIVDKLVGVDSLGLGIFNTVDGKRLYYGDARSSSVYSVPLSNKGRFRNSALARHEFSLLALKNGDSTQVRKIRFTHSSEKGHLLGVSDTEFSFRLQAETSRKFRNYSFIWNDTTKNWDFDRIH